MKNHPARCGVVIDSLLSTWQCARRVPLWHWACARRLSALPQIPLSSRSSAGTHLTNWIIYRMLSGHQVVYWRWAVGNLRNSSVDARKIISTLQVPDKSPMPSPWVKIGQAPWWCPPDASGTWQILSKLLISRAPETQSAQM